MATIISLLCRQECVGPVFSFAQLLFGELGKLKQCAGSAVLWRLASKRTTTKHCDTCINMVRHGLQ